MESFHLLGTMGGVCGLFESCNLHQCHGPAWASQRLWLLERQTDDRHDQRNWLTHTHTSSTVACMVWSRSIPRLVLLSRNHGESSRGGYHSRLFTGSVMAHILMDHAQIKRQELHNCILNRSWRSFWKESRIKCNWIMPMVSRGTSNPSGHETVRHWHAFA